MTTVNLLTAVQSADKPPPRGPLGPLLVGALALAVAATALYATAVNGVQTREVRLEAAKQEAAAATTALARLAPYVTYQQLAADRVTGVRKLAASRFPWERALDDLTRVLPADAKISDITASTTVEGGGGELRGANPAPAVSLTGCLGSQGRVPDLVSRLQTVRGVTEVALGSSTAAAKGTTGGCGTGGPTFDVVAFFGTWKDPLGAETDATGTGAAAAATPTPTATPKAGS